MSEYQVIVQLEFTVTAKNDDDAQERGETITDILVAGYKPTKKWMPEEIEFTNISVQV